MSTSLRVYLALTEVEPRCVPDGSMLEPPVGSTATYDQVTPPITLEFDQIESWLTSPRPEVPTVLLLNLPYDPNEIVQPPPTLEWRPGNDGGQIVPYIAPALNVPTGPTNSVKINDQAQSITTALQDANGGSLARALARLTYPLSPAERDAVILVRRSIAGAEWLRMYTLTIVPPFVQLSPVTPEQMGLYLDGILTRDPGISNPLSGIIGGIGQTLPTAVTQQEITAAANSVQGEYAKLDAPAQEDRLAAKKKIMDAFRPLVERARAMNDQGALRAILQAVYNAFKDTESPQIYSAGSGILDELCDAFGRNSVVKFW